MVRTSLPETDLHLWLIDPANMRRAFGPEETRRILEEPPYWAFCWASGLALSRWLAAHPETVRQRKVLDFGAGSGIAGIAAAKRGARDVVACDLDPVALGAARENAELNGVTLRYESDLFSTRERYDLLIAADVLYDRSNLPLLDRFGDYADDVIIADSRIRDFDHPHYVRVGQLQSDTLPDLCESGEFRTVSLYRRRPGLPRQADAPAS
nr:50S ribosomal protein L11 methyltransferase [Pseudomonas matsuisoli]